MVGSCKIAVLNLSIKINTIKTVQKLNFGLFFFHALNQQNVNNLTPYKGILTVK